LRENVTISYRGAGYEIGRGEHFYGIWAAGVPQSQPLEWWPDTPEGWSGAWSRFTAIEAPGTIVPASLGTASAGLGTASAGLGTASAGLGTASAGLGTASAGLGTASAGLGTASSSLGTASAGPGTAPVSPGTASAGLGTASAGLGTASAGLGTASAGLGTAPVSPGTAPVSGRSIGVVISAALLVIGVACGIAGLFPDYLGGASLAQQPAELVPHLIYLAVWGASAALILLGGTRMRVGALLGLGMSIVTFGLFFADVGQPIADGAHVMGAGLVLGLVGWLASAVGSAVAFRLRPVGAPGKPRGDEVGPVVMLMLAALGAAVAFAPSWDSYVLRAAVGASQPVTLGNAFANPAPVIAGDVAVMVALVAVVAGAALWRPMRFGAALLAGAIIPMVAQAISAFVQVGEVTSPTLFGISPAQAAASGLTISNGLTAVFWIYCAFVVAMIASCAWMLMTPHSAVAEPPVPPRPPQATAAWPASAPGVTEMRAIPAPDSGSSV
jgi:hypothetical protein